MTQYLNILLTLRYWMFRDICSNRFGQIVLLGLLFLQNVLYLSVYF
jgi:hypothetical protein